MFDADWRFLFFFFEVFIGFACALNITGSGDDVPLRIGPDDMGGGESEGGTYKKL